MKAERRHELKTNTLAHGLEGLPEFGRRYGTKILLGIVAVLTIVVFVRYQARASREAKEQATDTYAAAVAGIGNLQNLVNLSDGRAAAEQRKKVQTEATQAIQQVLDQSKDEALRADALLARGDLNWLLATLPEVRGADTQPTLKLEERDEDLLEKARAAYEAAARTEGASPLTLTNARLSLAAVAEERGKWDEARQHYEQVVADARTPEAFRNEAKVRLEDLADISNPVLIGEPATAPAPGSLELGPPMPTTARSTTRPTTTTAPSDPGAEPDIDPAAKPEDAPAEPAKPEETPVEAEAKPADPAAPEAPAAPDAKPAEPTTPEAPPAPDSGQPQPDAPSAPQKSGQTPQQ